MMTRSATYPAFRSQLTTVILDVGSLILTIIPLVAVIGCSSGTKVTRVDSTLVTDLSGRCRPA